MKTIVFALLLPVLAGAQPPEEAQIEAAQDAVLEGRAHLKAGRYPEGIAAYEKAHAAFPDPRHLFTIASAWERTDRACERAVPAWDRYLKACSACEDRPAADQRRAQLVARCPVKVTLTSDPSGAQITIAGEARGTTPLDVALAPGRHEVRAEITGQPALDTALQVAAGTPQSVSLRFGANVPVEVLVAASVTPAVDNTWAWVAFGVAGAGAVLGTVSLVQMYGSVDDFDNAETRGAASSAKDDADTQAVLAQVGLGVALAGAATGFLLWQSAPDESALTVMPTGVVLSGRF